MTTLLLGDCLQVMAGLPNKSVDLFICDLPYGQLSARDSETVRPPSSWNAGTIKTTKGCPWDIKIDLVEFWKQVKRLAKDDHTPVLMFCNTKFGVDLINSNPAWFRYDLVWDKERGVSFLLANKMPMKSHEMVYVFSKAGAHYNRIDISGSFPSWGARSNADTSLVQSYSGVNTTGGNDGTKRCPLSVIRIKKEMAHHRGQHPTEKPMELYEWLLSRYVRKDGVVLDPTAGSFNAILVAKKLGFKAIGIEKDNGFFWKGVAKLTN